MPGETEDQKAIADEIGNVRKEQSSFERREKEAVERLSLLKSDLVGLRRVKETLIGLNSQIKTTKAEMQAACTRFDLDVDAIIKYWIDTATIDT